MKVEQKDNSKTRDILKIRYRHPVYGENTEEFEGYNYFTRNEESFGLSISRVVGGHTYYIGFRARMDLAINKTYTLDRNDESSHAHLEIDGIDGDKYADGTFRLTRNGDHPQGVFDLVEDGVFAAKGEFDIHEVPRKGRS